MSEQDALFPPQGRAHPFVFVHEALPSLLHSDREKFVDYLRGPKGQGALDLLWRDVEKVVVENGLGDALPAGGLTAESVDGNGWRGVVIHMPEVQELGECALVLMAVPNEPVTGSIWRLFEKAGAPLTRLFMLKLVQIPPMKNPAFKVCELSPLLGHVTTGYTCATNAADFVREVVDRLDLED